MMKFSTLLMLLCMFFSAAVAQTKQVKGRITDNGGNPLSGVSVITDKKSKGTSTDQNGNYVVSVDSKTTTLIVSYVGFVTQVILIEGRTTIDVTLQPSQAALDDVVVVGYGTQRKSHLTGSISKYQNEKLDEIPVSRLDQALQGKIAGVQVQNLSSEAGSTPRIRVRGLNTINAGADPLVVVDGHPVPDGLAFVNMADVQSVEVLKDAASAAIYGSRAATGVIMVTTRSAKSDKPKYTLKLSSGIKSAYETQDMMTVSEYVNLLFNEAALRNNDPSVPANQKNRITNQERAQYVIENTIMGGVPTNWQDEALRTANMSNIQLSVSGGIKTLKYYLSGAYNKDEGLMYNSNYEKASIRAKFETQLGKRVKFNLNLNPTFTTRERPAIGYIDFVRFPSFLPARHTDSSAKFVNQLPQWAHIRPGDFTQVGHFNGRVYSGLMPDGSMWQTTSVVDPFASSNNTPKSVMETRDINNDEYRMLSTGDLTINLAKGLDFKTTGSFYVNHGNTVDFHQTNNNRQGDVNRGIFISTLFIDLLNENTLNYAANFGNHSITGLAGFTAQKTRTRTSRNEAINFPSDNIRTLNTALTPIAPSPTVEPNGMPISGSFTFYTRDGLLSYLARGTYSYNNKYLLSASIRTDGSSKFAPGHKWGTFPAVSVGWVASKEEFAANAKWLSNLKLRASYGVTGNNSIPSFAWVDQLYSSSYIFGNTTGTVASGQLPSRNILSNENITWERTFETNFGADLSLFKNAISLTADFYKKKSDQLLLLQSVMGFAGASVGWNNIGRIQNDGVELELTSNNIKRKNFTWTTTTNFSHNKNKLLDFGGDAFQLYTGERNEIYSTTVGFPAIRYWGYKTDGVWLSQAEADEARAKDRGTTNAAVYFTAGGLKLQDLNADGLISPADRTEIGSPFPEFTWAINNNLTYKSFDLSFLVQGVQGVEVINGDAFYNESRRYNRKYNNGNRWVSPLNPGDGKTPYFTSGFDWMLTDYVVEDGSYFALREVILGYKLPQKVAKASRLNALRIYMSVQNAFIQWADNYRGINPEARSTSGNYASPLIDGYQRGSFPMPRTILFGLDINF